MVKASSPTLSSHPVCGLSWGVALHVAATALRLPPHSLAGLSPPLQGRAFQTLWVLLGGPGQASTLAGCTEQAGHGTFADKS